MQQVASNSTLALMTSTAQTVLSLGPPVLKALFHKIGSTSIAASAIQSRTNHGLRDAYA